MLAKHSHYQIEQYKIIKLIIKLFKKSHQILKCCLLALIPTANEMEVYGTDQRWLSGSWTLPRQGKVVQ